MTIVWSSSEECWFVVEDQVELGRFSSLSDAESFVIAESKRREVQP